MGWRPSDGSHTTALHLEATGCRHGLSQSFSNECVVCPPSVRFRSCPVRLFSSFLQRLGILMIDAVCAKVLQRCIHTYSSTPICVQGAIPTCAACCAIGVVLTIYISLDRTNHGSRQFLSPGTIRMSRDTLISSTWTSSRALSLRTVPYNLYIQRRWYIRDRGRMIIIFRILVMFQYPDRVISDESGPQRRSNP
jgi:hypothetical protein